MKAGYLRATGLADAVRLAGNLHPRTIIFDIEPLVAYWDTSQQALDQGIERVLSEVAAVPGVQLLCFATNSARLPSGLPSLPGVRVAYLASAGKPARTAAYRDFPRPGVVIGDQVVTDGILARRLGYTFVLADHPRPGVPAGPRLMAAWGRLVRPLLFTRRD